MDGMLLLAACACSSLPTTHAAHATGFVEMECQLHTLALRFADRQQPSMGAAPRQALVEALRLRQLCGEPPPPQPPLLQASQDDTDGLASDSAGSAAGASGAATVVYVAPHGDDSAAGTLAAPFQSLLQARNAVRLRRKVSDRSLPRRDAPATVVLRGGSMHPSNPPVITGPTFDTLRVIAEYHLNATLERNHTSSLPLLVISPSSF